MRVQCGNCGSVNDVPIAHPKQTHYFCGTCGTLLQVPARPPGDNSEAIGLIGGAALGAALGGPPGAVLGGLIGAIIARSGVKR